MIFLFQDLTRADSVLSIRTQRKTELGLPHYRNFIVCLGSQRHWPVPIINLNQDKSVLKNELFIMYLEIYHTDHQG